MINKIFLSLFLFLLLSCGGVELVLKENNKQNQLKDKTIIILNGSKKEKFAQEIFSFLGNNKKGDYILITDFSEKKENVLVSKNQVAEKINYELLINYELYYKNTSCGIYKRNVVTKFSFVPKSFGYNFGTDRSLDKLYKRGIRKNIQKFINLVPESTTCI